MNKSSSHIYGPVPSRRLGKSLGVNNIPHKVCSYSCIYCQIGKALTLQSERQEFYQPRALANEVKAMLCNIQNNEEYPDYICIVPDGEPALDINLGELIDQLKQINIPVAVITNASLITMPEVRNDLLQTDYVSVKIDTVDEKIWKKINIPHKQLKLSEILHGIETFSKEFIGKLVSETMLVKGVNDSSGQLAQTANFIARINPDIAYISVPTRPPAFDDVEVPDSNRVNEAWHIFKNYLKSVELLTGYEGNAFSSTGNFTDDILSITAVHPMREDAVQQLLSKANTDRSVLDTLVEQQVIIKNIYNGNTFYLRKFNK